MTKFLRSGPYGPWNILAAPLFAVNDAEVALLISDLMSEKWKMMRMTYKDQGRLRSQETETVTI